MTISYLELVNHFLAGIGVHDVYTASKQEVRLYMGIDNWIREHQSDYEHVSEFAKDLRSLLQNESEIFSAHITMASSHKSFTHVQDSIDDIKQSPAYCSGAYFEDEKPTVLDKGVWPILSWNVDVRERSTHDPRTTP